MLSRGRAVQSMRAGPFAVGHSCECFSLIKDWAERKIRRHMGRARNRGGFGGSGGVGTGYMKNSSCLTATGFGGHLCRKRSQHD